VCVVAAAFLCGIVPGRAQQPVFRSGIEVVRVDVAVTRDNRPLTGLAARNFEIFDNGARQHVDGVIVEQLPLETVLVFDVSASVAGDKLAHLETAASAFFEGLGPKDRAALVGFSSGIGVSQGLTADWSAITTKLATPRAEGVTTLYDAVYAALRVREPGDTRGVVVIFTDGHDNASWLSARSVVEALKRSDEIVYAVIAGDEARTSRAVERTVDRFLRQVADASGGAVFAAANGKLDAAFRAVLEDVRSRYLLVYTPSRQTPGWHTIQVRLVGTKGTVRARRGYSVPDGAR
jgi:VWFA-related protein